MLGLTAAWLAVTPLAQGQNQTQSSSLSVMTSSGSAGGEPVITISSSDPTPVDTKTYKMGSNCTVTVMSRVITNGAATSVIQGYTISSNSVGAGGRTMSSKSAHATYSSKGGGNIAGGNGFAVSAVPMAGMPDRTAILQAMQAAQARLSTLRAPGGILSGIRDTNPVTWLGVATEEVSPDLRAQLTLPDGAGLIVRNVSKDSPAEAAGVQLNDILVKLDDQLLVNQPQLHALIHGLADGEETTLTVLRKAREIKLKAKLVKKVLADADAEATPIINLGAFNLDPQQLLARRNGGAGPLMFSTSFSPGGTNVIDTTNIQEVIESMQKAVSQLQNPNQQDQP